MDILVRLGQQLQGSGTRLHWTDEEVNMSTTYEAPGDFPRGTGAGATKLSLDSFSTSLDPMPSRPHRSLVLYGSLALLSMSVGLSVLAYSTILPGRQDAGTGKQCGSTPTEARSRDCIFEPQLNAWVPSKCAFLEIVAEYEDAVGDMHSQWTWYWDQNLTQPVSSEDIPALQTGNYSIIYTDYQRSHDLHCLYCWRKVSHALQTGAGMMDTRCHQFYHARHCAFHIAGTLLEMGQEKEEKKWAYPLMYHDCVSLDSTDEWLRPDCVESKLY